MSHDPISALPIPGYFSALAASYARHTGNTTLTVLDILLRKYINTSPSRISAASILHDNAAGPGTATAALLGHGVFPAKVLVSDNNPGMITAARDSFPSVSSVVTYEGLDSQDLSTIPDARFSHSITNFSIFAFNDPVKAVREIYRTLHPGGLAVVTCWRRFGVGEVIHAAQELVRPDLPKMPTVGPEFLEEGMLARVVAEGGFEDMQDVSQELLVREGENMDGLRDFMLSPFTERAREGWTAEEEGRWEDAVDRALREEVRRFGGVKFEAWAVLATK